MSDLSRLGLSAAIICAVFSTHGMAQANDQGIPGSAEASSVLAAAAGDAQIDLTPTGATTQTSTAPIEQQLPPDVPTLGADDPKAGLAERLPFAIDALMAQGRLPSLGAGGWKAAREAVRSLYVARDFTPIWTDGSALNSAGRSLLARLNRADEDGLVLKGLHLPSESFSAPSADRAAEAEVQLSIAAVVYALEASGARIVPQSISPLVTPVVPIANPLDALVDLAVAIDPGERLRAFNPQQPGYRRLREKLADLGKPDAVAEASSVSDFGHRLNYRPAFRSKGGRMVASAVIATMPAAFDPDSTQQTRARIEANMEMWRWEPRELGADRIEINIPDFTLRLYRADRVEDEMRVIVGKPDTATPVFSNKVKYLLINPIWRVPQSIVQKEMLPKAGGDLSNLEGRGFKVKIVGGQVFVEQPPGEANALGRLLFMFPNEHAVYLHDTPPHGLFSSDRRAYSHGCIRVEAPLRLASEVMGGDEAGWSEEKVESLFGPNERWEFLPAPLPIHIEYFTAFVDEDDMLAERADIYGITAKVGASLSRLSQD